MNAEPDTYPSEALADEEPRYLRRQKPLEIRRRKFARGSWPTYRKWLIAGAGLITMAAVGYHGTRFFLYSPEVALANYDQIEITGNHYVSRAAIAEKFAADLGRSAVRVPLNVRRESIEAIPWIAQAATLRTLPSHVRVEVTERTPIAFLRTANELALIDENGIILDRPLDGDFRFPVVSGLDEAMPLPDRAARMRLLVQFLKEIDLVRAGATEQVSEVQLSDAEDLRATIAGLPGLESDAPINVHFGESDFVNKYRLLVENIGPWRASAGHVESVDLRFPRQVVVNPERVATSRPVSKPVARPVSTSVSRTVAKPLSQPALHPSPHSVVKTVARKAPAAAPAAKIKSPKIKPAKIKPAHLKKRTGAGSTWSPRNKGTGTGSTSSPRSITR
jgi:cell division protein FtsQ